MRNTILLTLIAFTFSACNKDENNNESNATTAIPHSCGAKNVHNPNKTYGSVTDIDGNTYKTIQIGTQVWMAENLKTTKYRNKIIIPTLSDNAQWNTNNTGAMCSYNNNPANDCPYGKLYNWYAVTNPNNICPNGWHVPKAEEWDKLTRYLSNINYNIGDQMKSPGTTYWSASNNSNANNESGFSALPGGERNFEFSNLGNTGIWWSSTPGDIFENFNNATYRSLSFTDGQVYGISAGRDKNSGLSVRCVKD